MSHAIRPTPAVRWQAAEPGEIPVQRVLSIEHSATATMPPGGDTRKYGSTAITFYRSEE